MQRKPFALIAVAATVLAGASLAAAPGASGAASGQHRDPASRFESVKQRTVDTSHVRGLDKGPVTVMVQVAGSPVTVVQARAGHPISRVREASVRATIKARQRPVAAAATRLGGKVGARYQAAYNGMKVTIRADRVAALARIPGVKAVHQLTPKSFQNIHGVPLVGAPQVWAGVAGAGGYAGEGMKVAVIDTGIDFTHADFGGPGTTEAYDAALATDTVLPAPSLFGPGAPRVKGGTDLVGDAYTGNNTPQPDPNPLDCNGHGTHVAGTAVGSGVLGDGSTYTGPYGADTVSSHSWLVGPGVAPKADLYSVRVFGCEGVTNVVVDAIEWAVDHHMDVINMSLGSSYGGPDDPDAVAANNAAQAGTIVVTSAGNSGPNPYLVGSPSTGDATISTAALDPTASFPSADVALSTGTTLHAINANGIPVGSPTLPVKVLTTTSGAISLGCDPAEYVAAGVVGKLVVVQRGTCARVARAIYGQQAGAAAVLMVNNAPGLPPYEGPITSNPDTGAPYTVTIPFLGVGSGSAAALLAADGGTATLSDTAGIANPGYLQTASFSSGGARSGDSALKPDLTGPGVSIASAGVGTGDAPAFLSGTSMASPHVAGSAALVRQAHPGWGAVKYWKAALVNTADPTQVVAYSPRLNGSGLVQVQRAVATDAVALGVNDTATLSFGYAELQSNYTSSRKVTVQNFGNQPVTFDVGKRLASGRPHTVTPAVSSLTVPAHGSKAFNVQLNVPVTTVGDSSEFRDVAGQITLTPRNGANHGVALSMAYYLVPQAVSKVGTSLNGNQLVKKGTATASMSNGGPVSGNADWYVWGQSDPSEAGLGANDIRAVGVQSFPGQGVLAFAINTYHRWSNAASVEFDVYVDVNHDGHDDYVVVSADRGLLTGATANGQAATAVFDLRTGSGTIQFLTDAPTDSTTMTLPVLVSQLCRPGSPCLSAANPRISYYAVGFDGAHAPDVANGTGTYNVFTPAQSQGMFDTVAPQALVTEQVTLDKTEFALTPSLGAMVVTHDNFNASEATLIPFK